MNSPATSPIREERSRKAIEKLLDDHHAQVADIGVRRAGLQQPVKWLEKTVGVVAGKVIGPVEFKSPRGGQNRGVDDSPRGVGRTVLAVGAAGHQCDAVAARRLE